MSFSSFRGGGFEITGGRKGFMCLSRFALQVYGRSLVVTKAAFLLGEKGGSTVAPLN